MHRRASPCTNICKNKSLLPRNTATYVPNAARNCMRLGAHDVLGPAGWATTHARHAGERGGRQLARMFARTNWSFLVGFFPNWVRKPGREPRAETTLTRQHIDNSTSGSGQNENSPILGLCQLLPPAPDIGLPMLPPPCATTRHGPSAPPELKACPSRRARSRSLH